MSNQAVDWCQSATRQHNEASNCHRRNSLIIRDITEGEILSSQQLRLHVTALARWYPGAGG